MVCLLLLERKLRDAEIYPRGPRTVLGIQRLHRKLFIKLKAGRVGFCNPGFLAVEALVTGTSTESCSDIELNG